MPIMLQTPSQDILRDALDRVVKTILPTESEYNYSRTNAASTFESTDVIDMRINSLALAMGSLAKEVATQTLALSRLRNSLAKIHQLPLEVMVEIFDCYVQSPQAWVTSRKSENLHHLVKVSSLWAHIVQSSPKLWRDVELPLSESGLATVLRRSGSHPLNIYATSISTIPPSIWWSISQQIPRWMSAKLHIVKSVDLHTLEGQTAPQLISFSLDDLREGHTETALELFAGAAPKLLCLSLRGVALKQWGSPLVYGLRSLRLGDLRILGPSFLQILDILRASPELQHLSLNRVRIAVQATVTRPPSTVLSKLRSLELLEVSRNAMVDLLDSIRAPHCTAVNIFRNESVEQHQPAFPSIGSFILQPFKTILESHKRCSLSTGIGELPMVWFGRHTSPKFNVSLEGVASLSEVAQWVTASLSPTSSPLEIDLTILSLAGADGDERNAIAVLRRLPDIIALKVHGHRNRISVDAIIRALASPATSTTGNATWVCPRLQQIHFSYCTCSDPHLLYTLVEKRNGTGVRPPDDVTKVALIRSLHVHGRDVMNRRTFEKIEQYLGSQVTWEEDYGTEDEEMDVVDASTGSETGESTSTLDDSGDEVEVESEEDDTSSDD